MLDAGGAIRLLGKILYRTKLPATPANGGLHLTKKSDVFQNGHIFFNDLVQFGSQAPVMGNHGFAGFGE